MFYGETECGSPNCVEEKKKVAKTKNYLKFALK
jgi:hypothetical protein